MSGRDTGEMDASPVNCMILSFDSTLDGLGDLAHGLVAIDNLLFFGSDVRSRTAIRRTFRL